MRDEFWKMFVSQLSYFLAAAVAMIESNASLIQQTVKILPPFLYYLKYFSYLLKMKSAGFLLILFRRSSLFFY